MFLLSSLQNVATQKIRDLENEKNDFDMVRELAEGKLRRRNEELTRSLEASLLRLPVYRLGHIWTLILRSRMGNGISGYLDTT